jgi:hypothetical protein
MESTRVRERAGRAISWIDPIRKGDRFHHGDPGCDERCSTSLKAARPPPALIIGKPRRSILRRADESSLKGALNLAHPHTK